mmetsp:Transcript_59705/g.99102  ORF Transcript_59705/g.99102 Transcript_59705/m.99102 type:complete len:285 (+) Transcript_59705:1138-1992(+)
MLFGRCCRRRHVPWDPLGHGLCSTNRGSPSRALADPLRLRPVLPGPVLLLVRLPRDHREGAAAELQHLAPQRLGQLEHGLEHQGHCRRDGPPGAVVALLLQLPGRPVQVPRVELAVVGGVGVGVRQEVLELVVEHARDDLLGLAAASAVEHRRLVPAVAADVEAVLTERRLSAEELVHLQMRRPVQDQPHGARGGVLHEEDHRLPHERVVELVGLGHQEAARLRRWQLVGPHVLLGQLGRLGLQERQVLGRHLPRAARVDVAGHLGTELTPVGQDWGIVPCGFF